MGETPAADTSSAARRHAERARRREKPEQIADELRRLIIAGELDEGDSLGHEPDLIERFGVSRPSLREALPHPRGRGPDHCASAACSAASSCIGPTSG